MYDQNPFLPQDIDRQLIWNLLVKNQIEAAVNADWNTVKNDYLRETFTATDAAGRNRPDAWLLNVPDLDAYGQSWMYSQIEIKNRSTESDFRMALYRTNFLRNVQILGERALISQTLDAFSGREFVENRLYHLLKIGGNWKIQSVLERVAGDREITTPAGKFLPPNAVRHKTAGPYSPVLKVNPGQLVLISGQAPIDMDGVVRGNNIEDQTIFTLENCRRQLNIGGVDFEDVFKVNVFLTNLDLWSRFNKVYQEIMPKPFPVRTAVGTSLLLNFLVEIEMWATSKP